MRRSDHKLMRIDLLADEELDDFRGRFPQAEASLEQYDDLEAELDRRLGDAFSVEELEKTTSERPTLTVVVCTACGTSDVVLDSRPWDVDRAMRRTGRSERDVLEACAALREMFGGLRSSRRGARLLGIGRLPSMVGARDCARQSAPSVAGARELSRGSRARARRSRACDRKAAFHVGCWQPPDTEATRPSGELEPRAAKPAFEARRWRGYGAEAGLRSRCPRPSKWKPGFDRRNCSALPRKAGFEVW